MFIFDFGDDNVKSIPNIQKRIIKGICPLSMAETLFIKCGNSEESMIEDDNSFKIIKVITVPQFTKGEIKHLLSIHTQEELDIVMNYDIVNMLCKIP